MSQAVPGRSETAILWPLAWGVVALQTSLQLGWMIYRAWQPALLTRLGFEALLLGFALLPGVLGLIIEPLSGWHSDHRDAARRGRLLPLSIAVLAAGMIFLTAAGLLGGLLPKGTFLLPALMVGWVAAVQAAASPSLALLNDSAALRTLPKVAALVTLGHGLIGAMEAPITGSALRLGPTLTFLIGAVVLGLGLAVLRSVPSAVVLPALATSSLPARPTGPAGSLLVLPILGLAVGGLTGTLLSLLPRVQPSHGVPFVPVLLLLSSLTAPWSGGLASRLGAHRALLRGVVAFAAVLALALVSPQHLLPVLLPGLGPLLALVSTSLTAVALGSLPAGGGGLGSGLVLGGSGAAGSLLLLRFGREGSLAAGPVLLALALTTALALTALALVPHGPSAGQPRRQQDQGGPSP